MTSGNEDDSKGDPRARGRKTFGPFELIAQQS